MNDKTSTRSAPADKHRSISSISGKSIDEGEIHDKQRHHHRQHVRKRSHHSHRSHSDKAHSRRHHRHHHSHRRASRSRSRSGDDSNDDLSSPSPNSSSSSDSLTSHRRHGRPERRRKNSHRLTRAEALLRSESYTLHGSNDTPDGCGNNSKYNNSNHTVDDDERKANAMVTRTTTTLANASSSLVNEHRIRDRVYGVTQESALARAHNSREHENDHSRRVNPRRDARERRRHNGKNRLSSISSSSSSSDDDGNTHRSDDSRSSSDVSSNSTHRSHRHRRRQHTRRRHIMHISSSSDSASSSISHSEDDDASSSGSHPFRFQGISGASNQSSQQLQPTMDWVCGVCSNLNSASRGAQCFRCGVRYADSLRAVPSCTVRLQSLSCSDVAQMALTRVCGALQLHGESGEVRAARYDAHRRTLYMRFASMAEAIRAMVYCRCHVMLDASKSSNNKGHDKDGKSGVICTDSSNNIDDNTKRNKRNNDSISAKSVDEAQHELQRCEMSFADDAKVSCDAAGGVVHAQHGKGASCSKDDVVLVSGTGVKMQISHRTSSHHAHRSSRRAAHTEVTEMAETICVSLPVELQPERWTAPTVYGSDEDEKLYLQRMSAHWASLSAEQKAYYDERVRQSWTSKIARAAATAAVPEQRVENSSTSTDMRQVDHTSKDSKTYNNNVGNTCCNETENKVSGSSLLAAEAAAVVTQVAQAAAPVVPTATDKVALLKQRMAQRKAQMSSAAAAAAVKATAAELSAEADKSATTKDKDKEEKDVVGPSGGCGGCFMFFLDGFPIPADLGVPHDESDVSLRTILSSSSWQSSCMWTLSPDLVQRMLPPHLRPH